MTPVSSSNRWSQVRRIVEDALERSEGERDGFLRDACGDDLELLDEARRLLVLDGEDPGHLTPPGAETFRGLTGAPGDDDIPSIGRVGDYQLLEELGRGGMGVVYLARRADGQFEKRVAVKLIHRGLDSAEIVSRFEQERRVLASLDHPGIARLLDGGVAEDGRPYLVMEHVEGRPINRWCDERRLDIAGRLELFCRVCAAVDSAHKSLVVHRDLKPSNIPVDDRGQPKLLDFGIVKVLDPALHQGDDATRTSMRRLTPAYASPEQVRGGPITTASDTFSLGVILYQLLTGHLPLHLEGLSPAERERAVCEEEPTAPSVVVLRPAPSTKEGGRKTELPPEELSARRRTAPRGLVRLLRGDLDTIVTKALRKEPERRYASASQLADDLQRFAAGQPVSARPDTWTYRTGKLLRRHRVAAIALALVFPTLLGGWIFSDHHHRRANRDRADLEARLETDEERVARLEELAQDLGRANEKAKRNRGLAEKRAGELEILAGELQAETAEVDEQRRRAEGSLTEAQEVGTRLNRQRTIVEQGFQEQLYSAETLIIGVDNALRFVPNSMEATELVVDLGVEFLDALLADASGDLEVRRALVRGYRRLARVQGSSGRPNLGRSEAALATAAKALPLAETILEETPGDLEHLLVLGDTLYEYGNLLNQVGRAEEASEHFRRAIDLCGVFEREEPPVLAHIYPLATYLTMLGKHLAVHGRLDEAEEHYLRALPLYERSVELDPSLKRNLAGFRLNLVEMTGFREGWAAALPEAEELRRIGEELLEEEPENPSYLILWYCAQKIRAEGLVEIDRVDEAVSIMEETVERMGAYAATRPQDVKAQTDLLGSVNYLARLLFQNLRWKELRPHARTAVELADRIHAQDPALAELMLEQVRALTYLAACEREAGNYPESRRLHTRALSIGAAYGENHLESVNLLATMYGTRISAGQLAVRMAGAEDRSVEERAGLCLEALEHYDRARDQLEVLDRMPGMKRSEDSHYRIEVLEQEVQQLLRTLEAEGGE